MKNSNKRSLVLGITNVNNALVQRFAIWSWIYAIAVLSLWLKSKHLLGHRRWRQMD